MDDDIVVRLRLWASVNHNDHVIKELHNAADEIERLRLHRNHWKETAEKIFKYLLVQAKDQKVISNV